MQQNGLSPLMQHATKPFSKPITPFDRMHKADVRFTVARLEPAKSSSSLALALFSSPSPDDAGHLAADVCRIQAFYLCQAPWTWAPGAEARAAIAAGRVGCPGEQVLQSTHVSWSAQPAGAAKRNGQLGGAPIVSFLLDSIAPPLVQLKHIEAKHVSLVHHSPRKGVCQVLYRDLGFPGVIARCSAASSACAWRLLHCIFTIHSASTESCLPSASGKSALPAICLLLLIKCPWPKDCSQIALAASHWQANEQANWGQSTLELLSGVPGVSRTWKHQHWSLSPCACQLRYAEACKAQAARNISTRNLRGPDKRDVSGLPAHSADSSCIARCSTGAGNLMQQCSAKPHCWEKRKGGAQRVLLVL